MKCAHCEHFDIKTHPGHLKVGFGLCLGFPKLRGHFVGVKREAACEKFKAATEAVIEKRRAIWRESNAN